MNRKNKQLGVDEPVEVEDVGNNIDRFRGICRIYLKLVKKKPEDVNMQPVVGVGNVRISSNYCAQESLRTLGQIISQNPKP
jgi:hypothetical protein